jgi:peptide deformylase
VPAARAIPEGSPGRVSYTRAMSVLPILTLGDPRLRLKGEPVESFGKLLHHLIDDLTDTMRHAPGVGLAAPQLGEALNVAVVEVGDRLLELVNPRIVRAEGDGFVAYVTRREQVWVVAQNRLGRKYKIAGVGLLGRALQHELDHLQGKLYIDYLASPDELIPVGHGGDEDEDDDVDAELERRGIDPGKAKAASRV